MSAPPCVSLRPMKNGRPRPTFSQAQRYTQALTEAIQPPDDRTYSAEVTVFRRNLLHHRSARAVFPYTRSHSIPSPNPIVNHFFRKNHNFFYAFSLKSEKNICPSGRDFCFIMREPPPESVGNGPRAVPYALALPLGELAAKLPEREKRKNGSSGRPTPTVSLAEKWKGNGKPFPNNLISVPRG